MAEGLVDLGIHGIKFKGEALTEESSYSQMNQLNARANDNRPVDLGIHGVTMADCYMVLVDGKQMSGVLQSKPQAEQFINQLNEEDQAKARIVPSTSEGKQALFG